MGDRSPPVVFAGRDDEFELLNNAVQCTQDGEVGHTVVIKGVPGAGKTTLLNEYASRMLLGNDEDDSRLVVPVKLQAHDMDTPATALVARIDKSIQQLNETGDWRKQTGPWVNKAKLVGDFLVASATKKRLDDFLGSAGAAQSLEIEIVTAVRSAMDAQRNAISR